MFRKTFLIFLISLTLSGCSLNSNPAEKAKNEFGNQNNKSQQKVAKNNKDNIANKGEKVVVNYTGKLENGEVFDSTNLSGRDSLSFVLGKKQMIPGFEQGVIGMKIGETKTVNIPPEKAYGKYNEKLVQEVKKDRLKVPNEKLKKGVTLRTPQGKKVTIKNVGKNNVTVDMNHELAGKKLIFDIELVDIK